MNTSIRFFRNAAPIAPAARPGNAAARLLAAVLIVVAAGKLQADEAFLTSGNRLAGTVGELARGKLDFTVDGAGGVSIEWGNVERLRADRPMDVELKSGERLQGTIDSPMPGRLAVTTGGGRREEDMTNVVRIQPIAAEFSDRVSGSVDFGFAALGAHDERDLTVNFEGEHRTLNYLTEVSMSFLVRKVDGERAQDRKDIAVASRRFLSNRWFVIGQAGREENEELNLDSRTVLGLGAGRALLQSNRMVLSLYGGVDYAEEKFEGAARERSPETMGAVELDWFEVGGRTTASVKLAAFRNLDAERTLTQLDATLHREFFGNFYWSLTLYEILFSDPPPGAEDHDYGFTVGIGRNF